MADTVPALHVDLDADRVRIAYGQSLMFVYVRDLPQLVEQIGPFLPRPVLTGSLDGPSK